MWILSVMEPKIKQLRPRIKKYKIDFGPLIIFGILELFEVTTIQIVTMINAR
tara:strand:+ start:515 stop:670 length:156 start_codon:yes stop_codon:yes gene_type:complete